MRAFRLPRALAGEQAAPLMLVAGTRLEALRLLPLLRALRSGASPSGAVAFGMATAAAFTFDAAGRPAYDGLFYAADHGGGGGE